MNGRPGPLLRAGGVGQVGAGHPAHDQRAAGEHRHRPRAVEQQVAQVLRGMPGRGQRPQRQPAQIDLLAAAQLLMTERQSGTSGGEQPRAEAGQLPAAGDVVGMHMSVGGEGDPQPVPGGQAEIGTGVAARVHRQGQAVGHLRQVGAVAQALVGQRPDPGHRVPPACGMPAATPAGCHALPAQRSPACVPEHGARSRLSSSNLKHF